MTRNKTSSALDLERLERDGFVIIQDVLDERAIARINDEIAALHERAKRDPLWKTGGTLHLDGLLEIGDPFEMAWREPRVVQAVAALLGAEYRLTRAHLRSPLEGEGAQALHADYPQRPRDGHSVATAIVAIDPFAPDNGATRLLPGSHVVPMPSVPKDRDAKHPGELVISMRAGSALVFSGHLLHSGTRNRSGERRHAMQIVFARPDAVMFSADPQS